MESKPQFYQTEYQQEKYKLKEQLEKEQSVNKECQKGINNLNSKCYNLEKEKNSFQYKINEQSKQLEEKDKKIEELKQLVFDSQQTIIALKNKISRQQREYQTIQEQEEKYLQQSQIKIQETEQKNQLLIKQYDQEEQKIQELKDEVQKYQRQREQQINGNLNDENLSNYDLSINFTSLLELIDGVDINQNKSIDQNYHQKKLNENAILVSCLGRYNSGKTFVISNLTKRIFRQGQQYKTQGINIIYGKGDNESVYYADLPGFNEALTCYQRLQKYRDQLDQCKDSNSRVINEEFEEELQKINQELPTVYKNASASENFVQTFLQQNSEVLIMVVDRLDEEQQKRINFLSMNRTQSQKVLVIHNFYGLHTVDQVKNQLSNDIMDAFKIDIKGIYTKGEYFYMQEHCENKDNEKQPIIHLVLGKEGEESGNVFNEKTFKFIQSQILAINTKNKNIIQKFVDHSKKEVEKNIEFPKGFDTRTIDFKFNDNNIICEQLKQIKSQIKLRDILYDFWGNAQVQNYISPPYSIFETDDQFYIMIQFIFPQYARIENLKVEQEIAQIGAYGKYVLHFQVQHLKNRIKKEFKDKFNYEYKTDFPNKDYQQGSINFMDKTNYKIEICGSDIQLDTYIDVSKIRLQDGYICISVKKRPKKICSIGMKDYDIEPVRNTPDGQECNGEYSDQMKQQIQNEKNCDQQKNAEQEQDQI